MAIYDAKKGARGRCINLETGEPIPLVFWCDDTDSPRGHEYRQYVPDANGNPQLDPEDRTRVLERHVKGARIRFEPFAPAEMPPEDRPTRFREYVCEKCDRFALIKNGTDIRCPACGSEFMRKRREGEC